MEFTAKNSDENPKFRIGDHVKNIKRQKHFCKSYASNCTEEVFKIKKVKNAVQWTNVIKDLILWRRNFGTYYDKELQKTNQAEFRVER